MTCRSDPKFLYGFYGAFTVYRKWFKPYFSRLGRVSLRILRIFSIHTLYICLYFLKNHDMCKRVRAYEIKSNP